MQREEFIYCDWELLNTILVAESPRYSVSLPWWDILNWLVGRQSPVPPCHLIKAATQVWILDTGTMNWECVDPADQNPKKVVLCETLFCSGKNRKCVTIDNSTNSKVTCAFTMRWGITANDLQMVHMWVKGTHGVHWKADPKVIWLASHICKQLEHDGLDVGVGGLTTAYWGCPVGTASKPIWGSDIAPILPQVANLYNYEQAKCYCGKGNMVDVLQAALEADDVAELLLYPCSGNSSIVEQAKCRHPFLVLFMVPNVVDLIKWFGLIVRLDGIYKWNKMSWPIWAMVVKDVNGHSFLLWGVM